MTEFEAMEGVDMNEISSTLATGSYESSPVPKNRMKMETSAFSSPRFVSLEKKTSVCASSTQGSVGRENVSSRLFNAKEQKQKIRMREQLHLQKELQECTFKPVINKTPVKSRFKSSLTGSTEHTTIDVSERLYRSAEAKKRTYQRVAQEVRAKEKKDLTFKPKINKVKVKNRRSTGGVVFDRLSANNVSKLEERRRLKAEQEMKDCTFKPKLYTRRQRRSLPSVASSSGFSSSVHSPSRSVDSVQENGNDLPVWERLSRTNSLIQKQNELSRKKAEFELKDCTFDARKTIENLRLDQKKEQKKQVKSFLERVKATNLQVEVNTRALISPSKSSLDSAPSCFKTAMKMMSFSATKIMIKVAEQKYEKIVDLENNSANANVKPESFVSPTQLAESTEYFTNET